MPEAGAFSQIKTCPCGTGRGYDACCGLLHQGLGHARTAVDVMRSRYSAFVVRDGDYLLVTWHPQHRPARIDFAADQTWTGLDIHSTEAGGLFDTVGTVQFTANFVAGGVARQLHETSHFTRLDSRWVYVAAHRL
jgi:SEC-C motif-containing protein